MKEQRINGNACLSLKVNERYYKRFTCICLKVCSDLWQVRGFIKSTSDVWLVRGFA